MPSPLYFRVLISSDNNNNSNDYNSNNNNNSNNINALQTKQTLIGFLYAFHFRRTIPTRRERERLYKTDVKADARNHRRQKQIKTPDGVSVMPFQLLNSLRDALM